jgi:hypothetical protein
MPSVDLKEQLLSELSRRNIDLVVHWAGVDSERIDQLIELTLLHQTKLSMRACWALEKITCKYPGILQNWLPRLIENLNTYPESGTRRIMAKILMLQAIPEAYQGITLDFAIRMLESPTEPVAVKANCMTIIFNLLPHYPELEPEIKAIIDDQADKNTVGFKSRYKVLMQKHKKHHRI